MHPVHPQHRADRVDGIRDLPHRWPGADQIGGCGDRHQARARGQHSRDVVDGQLTGGWIKVRPAHGGAHSLGSLHPGSDISVVIEPGHDDLVPWAPGARQCPRQVVGERGGTAAEDDPTWLAAQQVTHGGPATSDDLLRSALRWCHDPPIGHRREQGLAHGIRDHLGGLCPARSIEVRGALTQGGEVAAH